MPRVVGVLALTAGAGYVPDAIAKLVVPQASPALAMIATPLEAGELAAVLWLAIVGARPAR